MKLRILLLGFAVLGSAFAQSVSLTAGSGSGDPGSIVSLPITLSYDGAAQAVGLQWTFGFSPAGAVTGYTVEAGPVATSSGKMTICGVNCLVTAFNTNVIPAGVVATVKVQLSPSASGTVTVNLNSPLASDGGGSAINPTTSAAGSIAVTTQVAVAGLNSLSCTPASFSAAGTAVCTVGLNAAAASDMAVNLSDNSANVTTPSAVTIPSGQAAAQFTATVTGVPGDEMATITASLNGAVQSANLTLGLGPVLSSVACSSGLLGSNQSATCSVNLNRATAASAVVALSSSSSQLAVPASVTIGSGQISAQFLVSSGTISAADTVTLTATLNGAIRTAQVLLLQGSGLSRLSCSPDSFRDSGSATCTLTLAASAASNTVVPLSNSSVNVSVPANVTVPFGQRIGQFAIIVPTVPVDETVTITASLNGGNVSATVALSPLPVLSSVSCAGGSLAGNQSLTCTATLNKPAVGDTLVALTDDSNKLTTPAGVTILNQQTAAQFTVTAAAIAASEIATVTASLGGVVQIARISLRPATAQNLSLGLSCSAILLTAGQSVLCSVTSETAVSASTVVALSGTNDSVAIPSALTIPAGGTSAQFRINAPATVADGTVEVTATAGSSTASFTINLQGSGDPDLVSLNCAPTTLAAAESALCTVTLSRSAVNDTVVKIAAIGTSVTFPGQVTIPVGSTTGTFAALVANITKPQVTTLYAAYSGKQVSAVLNLTGPAMQPSLQSFNCTPGTVPSGTSSYCTVTFTSRIVFPANLGIAANSNLLQVPSQMITPVGVTSVSFPIQARSTDTAQAVVLGLTWNGSAPQTKTIQVTPQASVAVDAPSAVFTRAGQPVAFDVKLVRSSSFGAQVMANALPDGATFESLEFAWTPTDDDVGEHPIEIRAIDNAGSTVSSIVRVVVRAADATIDSMVNPAGFIPSTQCASNSVMTLLGRGFSLRDADHASSTPLPTTLGGVRLRINSSYAPLLHVEDGLIHFQCPDLPAATDLRMVLEYEATPPPANGPAQSDDTLSVDPLSARATTGNPGLYVLSGTQGVIVESTSGLFAGAANDEHPARPAAPGDFLVIYGNGMGTGTVTVAPGEAAPLNPLVRSTATVLVDFGSGIKVPAAFAGLAPGYIGLFQVNVKVPSGTQFGTAVPITLEMQWPDQTLRSNTVTAAIQAR